MTTTRPGNIYGRRLREARESIGLSQTDLGLAVGLDESGASSRISRYETGVHQPKFGLQQLFAEALGVPLTYFYTEDDEAALLTLNLARHDNRGRHIEVKGSKKRR